MLITSSKQMWSKGGVVGAAAGPGRRWGCCAAVPQSLTHDEFVAHHKQARAKLFMSIPVVRETVRPPGSRRTDQSNGFLPTGAGFIRYAVT